MPVNCPRCGAPIRGGKFCPSCGASLQDPNTTSQGDACNDVAAQSAETPLPTHLLRPGTILQGRYEVQTTLGEGGFGITYMGLDRVLELKVAIKEYFPSTLALRDTTTSTQVTSRYGGTQGLEEGISSFVTEARTLARMSKQRYIVHTSNCFRENGTAYIVMDYVEGQTLKQVAEARGGKIPADELLPLVEPLLGAIGALHEQGLIHRDISPDNIMLTTEGEVCLLDFGCARDGVNGDQNLTVMLKYDYAPIEQYTNAGQGPWTDVYALCATLYRCLCGIAVPNAPARLSTDPIQTPTSLGVSLTPAQEQGLMQGLAVQPDQRLQSMAELHRALYESEDKSADKPRSNPKPDQSPANKTPATPRPPLQTSDDKPPKRIKPAYIAAGVAAVLLLVIVGFVAIGSGSQPTDRSTPTGSDTSRVDSIDVEQTPDDTSTTDGGGSSDGKSSTSSFVSASSEDTTFPDFGPFAGTSRFEQTGIREEEHFTLYTYKLLGDATDAVTVLTTYYSLIDMGMETISGQGLSSEYTLDGKACIDLGFNYVGTGKVYQDTSFPMGDPNNTDGSAQILLQCVGDSDGNIEFVKLYLPEGMSLRTEALTYDDYAGLAATTN